jgi:hypothetical protein
VLVESRKEEEPENRSERENNKGSDENISTEIKEKPAEPQINIIEETNNLLAPDLTFEPETKKEIEPEIIELKAESEVADAEPVVQPDTRYYGSINPDDDLPFANFDKKYSLNFEETPVLDVVEKTKEIKVEELHDEPVAEEKVSADILSTSNEIVESITEKTSKQTDEVKTDIDFFSWLSTRTKHTSHTEKPKEPDNETTPEQIPAAQQKKINKFNDLIDKFIETNPSISKPLPAKFYNPAEKARESITEKFDLVTETLARIYIRQGNYKKAILVYEKLSVINPERQAYFDEEIQNLKQLMNK